LELVFKLCIGSVSVRLSHTFDGTLPCSTKQLCIVAEQTSVEDDSLQISIEVIEAISTVECHSGNLQNSREEASRELESIVVSHRYLNHGTLDLVHEEVNRMRSRMTRRIEWKVEQASAVQRYFPQGESLCSSVFMAAGLEGLQFVFFPSGYTGAKEGFCSLFMFCPGGSMLRFWLSVGTQRREARISFQQPGFFGRTNFCRFENGIDTADDSILLVLEIEEAQQTEKQNLSHPVSPANSHPVSPANLAVSASSFDGYGFGEDTPRHISSTVKLQHIPGKQGLDDVHRLPSIWTSAAPGNIQDVLDGYHKFSDMRATRNRRGMNSAPCSPASATSLTSATTSKSDLHRVPWLAPPTPRRTRMAERFQKFAAYA